MPGATPSQTVGPFFTLGLSDRRLNELVDPANERAITIVGRVLDGEGQPVPDALLEIWQRGGGRDSGWGRCGTDEQGRYSFVTLRPGPVDGQAPHLSVLVFARGLLKPVLTRLYLADQVEANADDPLLAALSPQERVTLVAIPDDEGIRFDVHLQGQRQTTFFAL